MVRTTMNSGIPQNKQIEPAAASGSVTTALHNKVKAQMMKKRKYQSPGIPGQTKGIQKNVSLNRPKAGLQQNLGSPYGNKIVQPKGLTPASGQGFVGFGR